MKQELLDLYLDAIRCDDQSSIKAYHDAKARIAPSIVMDLILKEIELKETLKEMAEVIGKMKTGYLGSLRTKAENVLRKYHEQVGE